MAREPAPRRVHLLVVSGQHSPSELSDRLNLRPDVAVQAGKVPEASVFGHAAKENTWELHEDGPSTADISALLESLYNRISPVRQAMQELRNDGCRIILRIILYVSPTDPEGSGFVIAGEFIKWLSDVGVNFIDVDQYVVE